MEETKDTTNQTFPEEECPEDIQPEKKSGLRTYLKGVGFLGVAIILAEAAVFLEFGRFVILAGMLVLAGIYYGIKGVAEIAPNIPETNARIKRIVILVGGLALLVIGGGAAFWWTASLVKSETTERAAVPGNSYLVLEQVEPIVGLDYVVFSGNLFNHHDSWAVQNIQVEIVFTPDSTGASSDSFAVRAEPYRIGPGESGSYVYRKAFPPERLESDQRYTVQAKWDWIPPDN
ncbi:MAG: hypothetical protein F4X65_03770 [Chloroflexi bacterium]|nr:hypothetical protein [Chloroflexota bacterium]